MPTGFLDPFQDRVGFHVMDARHCPHTQSLGQFVESDADILHWRLEIEEGCPGRFRKGLTTYFALVHLSLFPVGCGVGAISDDIVVRMRPQDAVGRAILVGATQVIGRDRSWTPRPTTYWLTSLLRSTLDRRR